MFRTNVYCVPCVSAVVVTCYIASTVTRFSQPTSCSIAVQDARRYRINLQVLGVGALPTALTSGAAVPSEEVLRPDMVRALLV